jgi:hypothetical protein
VSSFWGPCWPTLVSCFPGPLRAGHLEIVCARLLARATSSGSPRGVKHTCSVLAQLLGPIHGGGMVNPLRTRFCQACHVQLPYGCNSAVRYCDEHRPPPRKPAAPEQRTCSHVAGDGSRCKAIVPGKRHRLCLAHKVSHATRGASYYEQRDLSRQRSHAKNPNYRRKRLGRYCAGCADYPHRRPKSGCPVCHQPHGPDPMPPTLL